MSQWDPSPGANPYGSPGAFSEQPDGHSAIGPQSVELIRQSRPWAIFVGVVAILMGLLMAMGSIGAAVAAPLVDPELKFILIGLYAILSVLGIVGGVGALRYGARSAQFVRSHTPHSLENVLRSIRNTWRFVGVVAGLFTALFIFQVINGVITAMRHREAGL